MGFKVPEGVDYIAVNHASWDTLADLHYRDENDWYKIKGFLDGEDRRAPIDIELMGDLTGKRVLHSQCHFGLDTLSAARMPTTSPVWISQKTRCATHPNWPSAPGCLTRPSLSLERI